MEKSKKKISVMTYGMYAGLGILVGVAIYYGYQHFMSATVPAIKPADAGASKNASGSGMTTSATMRSYYCSNPANANKPECREPGTTGAPRASWFCQDPKNFGDPRCNPTKMASKKMVSTSSSWA